LFFFDFLKLSKKIADRKRWSGLSMKKRAFGALFSDLEGSELV
jgi:hypothetical protein